MTRRKKRTKQKSARCERCGSDRVQIIQPSPYAAAVGLWRTLPLADFATGADFCQSRFHEQLYLHFVMHRGEIGEQMLTVRASFVVLLTNYTWTTLASLDALRTSRRCFSIPSALNADPLASIDMPIKNIS